MIFLPAQNPTIINLPSSSITCFLPFGWGKLPWTKSAVFFNIVETVGGRKSNPYKKCCTFKGLKWAKIILIHNSFYRGKIVRKKQITLHCSFLALFGSKGSLWDLFGECCNVDIVAASVGCRTVWLHWTKNLHSKELYFDCWSILFCILDLITLSVAMSTTSLPSSPANQTRSLDLKPKVFSPAVWSLFSSEFACFAHINQVCQLAKLPPEMIALISR